MKHKYHPGRDHAHDALADVTGTQDDDFEAQDAERGESLRMGVLAAMADFALLLVIGLALW